MYSSLRSLHRRHIVSNRRNNSSLCGETAILSDLRLLFILSSRFQFGIDPLLDGEFSAYEAALLSASVVFLLIFLPALPTLIRVVVCLLTSPRQRLKRFESEYVFGVVRYVAISSIT